MMFDFIFVADSAAAYDSALTLVPVFPPVKTDTSQSMFYVGYD